MYTNSTDYETYTSDTAPADYTRQELYATTLFKSVYPNFPSESQFADLDSETIQVIEYAIFEQINASISYSGTAGSSSASSFSVGNFSVSDSSGNSVEDKISLMAQTYLQTVGVTFKGVGLC